MLSACGCSASLGPSAPTRGFSQNRGTLRWLPSLLCAACLACSPAPPPEAPAPSAALDASPQDSASAESHATGVEIAVTVDDLPVHGPAYPGIDRVAIADAMLAAFRKHRLPPVYGFVNGKKVADDPSTEVILARWVAAGNPLGNHTYSHISLNEASVGSYLADLEQGEAILQRFMKDERAWRVFRYPYLFEGPDADKRGAVRRYLAEHHYRVADVTIDGDDWAWNPPFARCMAKGDQAALAELRRGYVKTHVSELRYIRELTRRIAGREIKHILLLHVGAADADAIDELLTAFEAEGARFIGLDTALADPIYGEDHGLAMKAGAALPYKLANVKRVPFGALPTRPEEDALEATCR